MDILITILILTPVILLGIKLKNIIGEGYTDNLAKNFNYTYEKDDKWEYDPEIYLNAFGKEFKYQRDLKGQNLINNGSEYGEVSYPWLPKKNFKKCL